MKILITGASSGIGAALAQYYAQEKHTLFICGRNLERLNKVKELCEKYGAEVYAEIIDVTKKDIVSKWIEKCVPIDLVIANAGVATLEEIPENIFNTFEVNVIGVVNTITPAIELFKESGKGQVAIISSIAGYHGLPSCPSYSASKACVKAYGEALRGSLVSYGVKVNVICPGFVRSGITDKNKFAMPFFMETEKAAEIIAKCLKKNKGIIAFPWPMRFMSWLISILPNFISEFIYVRLPNKA